MVELQGVIWRVVSASTLHHTTLFCLACFESHFTSNNLVGPLSVVWCSIRVVLERVLHLFKLLFNR